MATHCGRLALSMAWAPLLFLPIPDAVKFFIVAAAGPAWSVLVIVRTPTEEV